MSPEERAFLDEFKEWKHRPKEFASAGDDASMPQQVYADLMKTRCAPALRSVGLKGSNGRFELPSDKYWIQLGFQKSAYSDGQEVRFAVNLSVIQRARWEAAVAVKPYLGKAPSPSTRYGQIQQSVRLGQLVTGGNDHWWSIARGIDVGSLAEEVTTALLDLGVPWLVARSRE